MNPQVDPLQVLDSLLDRQAAPVSDLLKISCFPSIRELKSAVEAYGARFTRVAGNDYVIKNNSQRERVVADIRAMNFWLREVVSNGEITVGELRFRAMECRIPWTLLKRISREQGWYVVGETDTSGRKPVAGRTHTGLFDGSEVVKFVGYEMDYDLRFRICRVLKEALESGVDLDSPLAWQMVERALVGWFVTPVQFEICVELVKNGFYGSDVE